MKKLLLNLMAAAVTVCSLVGISAMSPAAYAMTCLDGTVLEDNKTIADCPNYSPEGDASKLDSSFKDTNLMNTLNTVLNIIIGVIGFVAVVMMIIGGINFVISQGDSAKVTKARNTILYGVVGLVVALLAFAIVNFVLSNVFKASSSTTTSITDD